jgi:poly(3-hydroxybutyrate) depolymerase
MAQHGTTSTHRRTRGARTLANAGATLAAAALVAALVGCGPTPPPAPPATSVPEPTPTVSEAPTPDPVAEALTIPSCDALLPIATAQSAFGDATAFLSENVATTYYPWYQLSAVNAAISGVTLARSCTWGVPSSDGAFTMLVAQVDPATRASIEAALTTEGFSSVVMGTVTAREAEREGDFQTEAETHLFTGTVWILADDGSLSVTGIVAGSALDALRTANPTLGL